jgi:hypothetical protein
VEGVRSLLPGWTIGRSAGGPCPAGAVQGRCAAVLAARVSLGLLGVVSQRRLPSFHGLWT